MEEAGACAAPWCRLRPLLPPADGRTSVGRKERPIASSNRALVKLARWLRDQRSDSGCSYAELAARVGVHATTLQRAASGQSVPSERSVRAYAVACGASVDTAMDLWRQARRGRLRMDHPGSPAEGR
ncbi:helix-turn-helix transcriptional regulator [Streptomyces sp. NPDC007162]|uniref:helix-turn-helix domain-containing protein n=1 Tax=Streptomyces sp. NPDC007162 TaxID=3156917 RepID=UPI0033EE56A2